MSRILFLTQVLPYPLDAGPKTRAYYVLRRLLQSHQVSLLSFSRAEDTPSAIAHLRELCQDVDTVPMRRNSWREIISFGRSLLSNQPFLITRDDVSEMNGAIRRLMSKNDFDCVHADQLWMVQYALRAKNFAAQNGRKIRMVLDQHNAVYLIPKRLLSNTTNPLKKIVLQREYRQLARYEAEVSRLFDCVVWVTQEDREAVERVNGSAYSNSMVIPICVDTRLIRPVHKLSSNPNILFLGGMHWPPNAEGVRWFVQKVLPLIRSELPEVRLIVVGKSPPKEILDLPGVIATGFVENVDLFWQEARAFIVPIHAAGGMRVKILDAWAFGIPVISTRVGAEGIKFQPGENIEIAEHPEDFARCVTQVLRDPSLAESLSKSGRQAVEALYDWNKIYQLWDDVHQ